MTTYIEWKKKSKRMAYTVSLLPNAEAVLNTLARAAFQAGQRHGENRMKENWVRSEQRRKQGLPL